MVALLVAPLGSSAGLLFLTQASGRTIIFVIFYSYLLNLISLKKWTASAKVSEPRKDETMTSADVGRISHGERQGLVSNIMPASTRTAQPCTSPCVNPA